MVCDGIKGLPLSFLSSLSIGDMQERKRVAMVSDSGADTAIHSAADQDDGSL